MCVHQLSVVYRKEKKRCPHLDLLERLRDIGSSNSRYGSNCCGKCQKRRSQNPKVSRKSKKLYPNRKRSVVGYLCDPMLPMLDGKPNNVLIIVP